MKAYSLVAAARKGAQRPPCSAPDFWQRKELDHLRSTETDPNSHVPAISRHSDAYSYLSNALQRDPEPLRFSTFQPPLAPFPLRFPIVKGQILLRPVARAVSVSSRDCLKQLSDILDCEHLRSVPELIVDRFEVIDIQRKQSARYTVMAAIFQPR